MINFKKVHKRDKKHEKNISALKNEKIKNQPTNIKEGGQGRKLYFLRCQEYIYILRTIFSIDTQYIDVIIITFLRCLQNARFFITKIYNFKIVFFLVLYFRLRLRLFRTFSTVRKEQLTSLDI